MLCTAEVGVSVTDSDARKADTGVPEAADSFVSALIEVSEPEVVRLLLYRPGDWLDDVKVWTAALNTPAYAVSTTGDPVALVHAVTGRGCDLLMYFCDRPLAREEYEQLRLLTRAGAFATVCVAADGDHLNQAGVTRRLGVSVYVPASGFGPELFLVSVRAALEQARLRRALDDLQGRFALSVRGANDGFWEWTLGTGEAYFSRRWCELLGLGSTDARATIDEWLSRVHPDDFRAVRANIDAHLAGQTAFHETEHRVRGGDDEYRWVLSRGVCQRDERGKVVRMAGSLTDISEFREREQTIRQQSRQDGLTGLPRKELYMERLARAVELSAQYADYRFVAMMVEIDRLRLLNESIGHRAGDSVLTHVAQRIRSCVETETLVARLGGAKFAILVENVTDYEAGNRLAHVISESTRTPFDVDGQPVYVTVSIGFTTSERAYGRAEDVITDVTSAATQAKHSQDGGGRHLKFNTRLRMEALSRVRLEMALRRAVERDEFILHYQPIVSLETGYLMGFEALLRWNSPDRGQVSPGDFIPVAEQTGLIRPIGRWVFRVAAKQLRAWHEEFGLAGQLSVSVNLSGAQVADPDLLQAIARALRDTGVDPGSIKVELTESVVMENTEDVNAMLNALRQIGVQIWIDDFGTGYSSLSYLHQFPVDGLKIDKTFVDALDGTPESEPMIRTIVSLAEHLGVYLVAEGIERKVQADHLRKLRCGAGQGFLFGKPMSAPEARTLIASAGD